jgi:hypothetical protein
MRVNEGDYAYDIEPVTDRNTLVFSHFKVVVLRKARVDYDVVFEGKAKTIDEARDMAEKQLRKFQSNSKRAA